MKTEVLSFHGKQEIKDQFIARVKAHAIADEIIKGQYWEDGKGCAVGCTVHSSSHDAYESELGITWRLALVEDSIFEKLPNAMAKDFPLEFLEAIPVGVDTNIAFKNWTIWILSDEKDGLIQVIKDEDQKTILTDVFNLYKESFTREIQQVEWQKLLDKANRAYAYTSASASAYASAYTYAYTYAYTSASASASAYAYTYAYTSASASASASAYAYTSAYASAYAYASASAYAYAYASASASPEWQKIFNERIILMKNKLIECLKALK